MASRLIGRTHIEINIGDERDKTNKKFIVPKKKIWLKVTDRDGPEFRFQGSAYRISMDQFNQIVALLEDSNDQDSYEENNGYHHKGILK